MRVEISIVIPAYNEANRLPGYLNAIRCHYSKSPIAGYEVIVVDDGSNDGTGGAVRIAAAEWPELVLIEHTMNRGKGAAVRTGMLAARGEMVLFADADGATPIEEERKFRAAISAGADLAIGSRRGGLGAPPIHRPWFRYLTGLAFSGLARKYIRLPLADPQCGFKMFDRSKVSPLFAPCRENGYLFDLYILGMAIRTGCRIKEIPVIWREIPGSKIDFKRDLWRMLLGLVRIRKSLRHIELQGRSAAAIPTSEEKPEPELPGEKVQQICECECALIYR